jgi:RNA polymerase sigma-70 factor (ECF subfamily)
MGKETTLLQQARRFESAALAEIYDTYSPELYRYATRLLGNSQWGEECVAETFSRLLHALNNGGGPTEHVRAYLYRVAHNWITDTYRRQPLPPLPLDPQWRADERSNPVQFVGEQLERERVRVALYHLTPEQRQVIVLRFLEGWTNREVATAMEKSVGAVKALHQRALAALRRMLIEQETEKVI